MKRLKIRHEKGSHVKMAEVVRSYEMDKTGRTRMELVAKAIRAKYKDYMAMIKVWEGSLLQEVIMDHTFDSTSSNQYIDEVVKKDMFVDMSYYKGKTMVAEDPNPRILPVDPKFDPSIEYDLIVKSNKVEYRVNGYPWYFIKKTADELRDYWRRFYKDDSKKIKMGKPQRIKLFSDLREHHKNLNNDIEVAIIDAEIKIFDSGKTVKQMEKYYKERIRDEQLN